MKKIYIDHAYPRHPNLFDVMYGGEDCKLAEGDKLSNSIQFENISLINEMFPESHITEEMIAEAARWCRSQGYRTFTSFEGWIEP